MLVAVRIRELLRNVEQSLGSVVERAVPARGACVVQAHLAAVVAEIAGDRERRRGKNPSARVTVELPLENPRDGKRRGIQAKRVTEHLDPAHQIGATVVAPAFEQGLRVPSALGAARKTLAAFGERIEGCAYRAQRGIERGERIRKYALSPDRCRGEAGGFAGQREAQIPGRLVQRGGEPRRIGHVLRGGERFGADIPRELDEVSPGQRLAEKERGGFRKPVGFGRSHGNSGRAKAPQSLGLWLLR